MSRQLSSEKVDEATLNEAVDAALTEAKESGDFDEVYVGSGTAPEGTTVQVDPNGGEEFTIPDVLQTTGNSEEDTMSQKSITAAIEAMVGEILTIIGTPIAGAVDENKVITLGGELADGTYTLRYYNQGEYVELCTLTISGGGADTPPDTTLIWELGTKIDSSTGVETTGQTSYSASNYIEIVNGYTYKLTRHASAFAHEPKVAYYDENKNFMSVSATSICSGTTATTVTVPLVAGAKYFRFRNYGTATEDALNESTFTLTAEVSE